MAQTRYYNDSIEITHFINPHLFWFKLKNSTNDVRDHLETRIEEYVGQKADVKPIVGNIVAVYHSESQKWIRAEVDVVCTDGLILWAIDYGFPMSTKNRFIRPLSYDLRQNIENVFVGGIANIVPCQQVRF